MTELLPRKPLTRETSLVTCNGVLVVTLADGPGGQRTTLYGSLELGNQATGYSATFTFHRYRCNGSDSAQSDLLAQGATPFASLPAVPG